MTDVFPPTRRFTRSPNVIQTEVDGEVVLLDTVSWNYYDFDRVGAAIWKLLETPQRFDALVGALVRQFTVDESRCTHDTQEFLAHLQSEGLVNATDP